MLEFLQPHKMTLGTEAAHFGYVVEGDYFHVSEMLDQTRACSRLGKYCATELLFPVSDDLY